MPVARPHWFSPVAALYGGVGVAHALTAPTPLLGWVLFGLGLATLLVERRL